MAGNLKTTATTVAATNVISASIHAAAAGAEKKV